MVDTIHFIVSPPENEETGISPGPVYTDFSNSVHVLCPVLVRDTRPSLAYVAILPFYPNAMDMLVAKLKASRNKK